MTGPQRLDPEFVRRERLRKGMTNERLALRSSIELLRLVEIEDSLGVPPSADEIGQIARALGVLSPDICEEGD